MQTGEPISNPDDQAVRAVRGGDAERYRELVERHERRVYAVAWSRLGDAALAEDATQEAFIRGYRHLGLLDKGEKFGPWIASIARRVAINLGFRHRRELNRRERWGLEHSSEKSVPPAGSPEDFCAPETLRQAMAELPNAHRECLVLFYLEGRSGAEAAAALGISEAAFRVRLHRARGALREQLESRLETSLQKLRPARSVVPAVMAGVLVSSSAKAAAGGAAAGIGTKVLAVLGKSVIFSWIPAFVMFGTVIPVWPLVLWLRRLDLRNYRDPEGFRAKGYRRTTRAAVLWIPLIMILGNLAALWLNIAFGINALLGILFFMLLSVLLGSARLLAIQRNPFQIANFAYSLIVAVIFAATLAHWLPVQYLSFAIVLATSLIAVTMRHRPAKMDYNLFLRAANGLLAGPAAETASTNMRPDRSGLEKFARFLGSRWLVMNYRWEIDGLRLRTAAMRNIFLANMLTSTLPMYRPGSFIFLRSDGTVSAHLDEQDAAELATQFGAKFAGPTEIEGLVARAAGRAWQEFQNGNLAGAEKALGEVPDEEVFVIPVRRSPATRLFMAVFAVSILIGLFGVWLLSSGGPAWLEGLHPVAITEPQVRAFLNDTTSNPDTNKLRYNSAFEALFNHFVLPGTNLFDADGLRAMHQDLFFAAGHPTGETPHFAPETMAISPILQVALVQHWLDWPGLGLDPSNLAAMWHQPRRYHNPSFTTNALLARVSAWSWVQEERFETVKIQNFQLNTLRWLRNIHSLDVPELDREGLTRQILSTQILSPTPWPGQKPLHDWKNMRGLFYTPCYPALQDTYVAVATLELLGGLDRMDREACIAQILKLHRGEGYFRSPMPGSFNEYHIDGSARDTIAAFETLRILGALDRVKDLDHWQFRPRWTSKSKDGGGKTTWDEVEAWVATQRLQRYLREHKENPQAPAKSLLDP